MTRRRGGRMTHPMDPQEPPDLRPIGVVSATDEVAEPASAAERRRPHRRPRGILAFLPDEGDYYPYDEDYWKKKMAMNGGVVARAEKSFRMTSKRRRQRLRRSAEDPLSVSESAGGESIYSTVSTVEWFHDANDGDSGSTDICSDRRSDSVDPAAVLLVLFCFDPGQRYSSSVRDRLVLLCEGSARISGAGSSGSSAEESSARLRCVAISAHHRTPEAADFLRNTGFTAVPWSSQLATLGIVPPHTPSLAVYLNHKKVSCSHEELGLEWNSTDDVIRCWRTGQSSLSCSQQVLANAIFPTTCAVL
jgi:hypothetical protein